MYSVNMPNWDDYDAILDWLNFNVTNHDAAKFFQILFSQATEHRIVFDRLVTLIYYYLFKSVNFSILTFLVYIPVKSSGENYKSAILYKSKPSNLEIGIIYNKNKFSKLR